MVKCQCRGTVMLTKPSDGFQAKRKEGDSRKIVTVRYQKPLVFPLATAWFTILKHPVDLRWLTIFLIQTHKRREGERCTGDPIWTPVTVGWIEVADIQHSPSGSNYKFSWNQLSGKQNPREEVGHAATLIPSSLKIILYSEIKYCAKALQVSPPHTWFNHIRTNTLQTQEILNL